MADTYTHLIGAERVESAARTFAAAAEQLTQNMQWEGDRRDRAVERFEAAVERLIAAMERTNG